MALDISAPVKNAMVKVIYDRAGGSLASASTIYLHKGINQWNPVDTPDVAMTRNATTGFYEYSYRVSNAATKIDLVFTNGAGIWDSNGGLDWHYNTSRCGVSPAKPVKGQTLKVSYNPAGGPLAAATTVKLHYGINNWGTVYTDLTMTKDSFGVWSATLTVPTTATQLDIVFNNGATTWDNNGGVDWHYVTQ